MKGLFYGLEIYFGKNERNLMAYCGYDFRGVFVETRNYSMDNGQDRNHQNFTH